MIKKILLLLMLIIFPFLTALIPVLNLSLTYDALTTLGNKVCYSGYENLISIFNDVILAFLMGLFISAIGIIVICVLSIKRMR